MGSWSKAPCPSLWPKSSLLFQPAAPPSLFQLPGGREAEMIMPTDNFRTFPPPCHQQSLMKQKKETGRPGEEMASGKVGRLQVLVKNCCGITHRMVRVAKNGNLGYLPKKAEENPWLQNFLSPYSFRPPDKYSHLPQIFPSDVVTYYLRLFCHSSQAICLTHHFTRWYFSP